MARRMSLINTGNIPFLGRVESVLPRKSILNEIFKYDHFALFNESIITVHEFPGAIKKTVSFLGSYFWVLNDIKLIFKHG